MSEPLPQRWHSTFLQAVERHRHADPLKEAALAGRLGDWTSALTTVVVSACGQMGWQASAKGHTLDLLPVPRSEYLALDVMAFAGEGGRWRFPVAVMELENSRDDDYIAYSLWKVLCVRARLRVVYCYRQSASERAALLQRLGRELLGAIPLAERGQVPGRTLVVVGTLDEASNFPYSFFKPFAADYSTGRFASL